MGPLSLIRLTKINYNKFKIGNKEITKVLVGIVLFIVNQPTWTGALNVGIGENNCLRDKVNIISATKLPIMRYDSRIAPITTMSKQDNTILCHD